MAILTNRHGHRLETFQPISSLDELKQMPRANGGHAVVFYESKIVVCHNKYRNNWELPGGGRETGESLEDCLLREIYEETGQQAVELQLKGLSTVFIPRMNNTISWAIFSGRILSLNPFLENDEMSKMMLWNLKDNIGDFDELDRKIIELAFNL